VNSLEGRKPLGVVSAEEEEDGLVGVYAEELADHFYGENLRVGKFGGGSALADAPILDTVVDEAEYGDDEGAKIHERRPPLRWLVWSLPSVRRSSL
jgi:hypothetical protein